MGCAGLTPHGRRQAEALRDHLAASGRVKADVLLVSVLPRAIETAQIIAPGLGLEIARHECDLCEVHTGEADGLAWEEYTTRYGSFDMEAEPDRVFAPEGESWNSFHERVQSMLERLAADHPDETVVAVCHAGVIMASMRGLLGLPHAGRGTQLRPTNTGLTEWEHDPVLDRWTLHSFNEAGHLLGLPPPSDRPSAASDSDWSRRGRQGGMTDREDFTVEAARRAAERDELGDWVARVPRQPRAATTPSWATPSPTRPAPGSVRCGCRSTSSTAWPARPATRCWSRSTRTSGATTSTTWRRRSRRAGSRRPWSSPTATTSSHLEDGNHRVEGLRRAGEDEAWAVVSFDSTEERDRFLARAPQD